MRYVVLCAALGLVATACGGPPAIRVVTATPVVQASGTATPAATPTSLAPASTTRAMDVGGLPTSTAIPTPTATETVTPSPTRAPPTAVPPTPIPTRTAATACPQGCTEHKPGCDIKGNVSFSTGEKIYHVPGGRYYNSTVIDPRYGERWFCTEAEAAGNGWRKSSQ